MFHTNYIITQGISIENAENKTINVLSPEQINAYQIKGYKYKERIYKLTLNKNEYEVVCAEIWKKGNNEHSVIIPAFLLPHRPYPLEVYIYALNLYSGSPKIGYRTAAEATKNEYKLETFSHTTIVRAMKTLSVKLEENQRTDNESDITNGAVLKDGVSVQAAANMNITGYTLPNDGATVATEETVAMTKPKTGTSEEGQSNRPDVKGIKKYFPLTRHTKKRRELINKFIRTFLKVKHEPQVYQTCQKFTDTCERMAVCWYMRFKKLLI